MEKPTDEFQFHDVVDVVFGTGYVLKVKFDDGAERTTDFEPILPGPLFGSLRDPGLFRQVSVDAIVQRRRQRFAAEASAPEYAQL